MFPDGICNEFRFGIKGRRPGPDLTHAASRLRGCPKYDPRIRWSEPATEAVRDTIQILEKTKRSFRSKELGALRTRLEKLNGSAATSVQAPWWI